MQLKRYCIFLFAIFFLAKFANSQQVTQLTNDSRFDYMPDFYNNRIAWIKGTTDYETEVFLAQGDEIKQITNSKTWKVNVRVGQKYIIWSEAFLDNSSVNYLMCYDGEKTFCLDTSTTAFERLNTAANTVVWRNRINDYNFKTYYYDGTGRHIFRHSCNLMVGNLTSAGFYYSFIKDSVQFLAFTDFTKDEVIDSCKDCQIRFHENLNGGNNYVNIGSKDKGKTLFYTKIYEGTKYEHIFLINGVKNHLHNGITNRSYSDYSAHIGRDYIAFWNTVYQDSLVFWRNGKFMTVGSPPFENVNTFPELNDITFGFFYEDDEPGSKISIFSRNKIYTYSGGLFHFHQTRAISFGNSVAWSASSKPWNLSEFEIFYFNDENDSLKISAKPISAFKGNIYHKNSARQIAIELETPKPENYLLSVYDFSGRIIASEYLDAPVYGKQNFTFSTENFRAGLYIVRLQNSSVPSQRLTAKLLIH